MLRFHPKIMFQPALKLSALVAIKAGKTCKMINFGPELFSEAFLPDRATLVV